MSWLVASIVLSVVLTFVLNVALRASPRSQQRLDRWTTDLATPRHGVPDGGERGVRVIVPWKAMLIGSLVLTVGVNLVLWLL